MDDLKRLLDANRAWAARVTASDPDFFRRLTAQQSPRYLWIGCSDSRVPANQVVDLAPGEIFVHRNIANIFVPSDLNCLSVLQYAVDVLKVEHVIVCGHYGCGGVKAALLNQRNGAVDHWLRHVYEIAHHHAALLDGLDPDDKLDRLCELNVIEQVKDVCQTVVVGDAWARGQKLSIHGWIYDLADGVIRDLAMSVGADDELMPQFQTTVRQVASRKSHRTIVT